VALVEADDGKESREYGTGKADLIKGDVGASASFSTQWLAEDPASLASLLE